MKICVSAIIAAAISSSALAHTAAVASDSKGPKVIEIDEAGNFQTSNGIGNEIRPVQGPNDQPKSAVIPSEAHARMSICDPRYRWEPRGISSDSASRARSFYRDVTRKYEMAQLSARKQGTPLSRERENQYWNAYKRLMDSVPRNERKIVERGISPRLSWWCNAPPVIAPPVIPKAPRPTRIMH